jgi:hypothetical protein
MEETRNAYILVGKPEWKRLIGKETKRRWKDNIKRHCK